MVDIVRKIGEQSLVDVEHPNVLAILIQLNPRGVITGLLRNPLEIAPISPTHHVILHVLAAFPWDRFPGAQIVGLDGESPTGTL